MSDEEGRGVQDVLASALHHVAVFETDPAILDARVRSIFAAIFDMQMRVLIALSHDHRFTSALIAQREKVIDTAVKRPSIGLPFLPVLGSTNPSWNAKLNLTSVLREEGLRRELDELNDTVRVPNEPYFLFGVQEDGSEFAEGGCTAAEIISFELFTRTLLWHPDRTYLAAGSTFPGNRPPIFGVSDGHQTFRMDLRGDTRVPLFQERACFLP